MVPGSWVCSHSVLLDSGMPFEVSSSVQLVSPGLVGLLCCREGPVFPTAGEALLLCGLLSGVGFLLCKAPLRALQNQCSGRVVTVAI